MDSNPVAEKVNDNISDLFQNPTKNEKKRMKEGLLSEIKSPTNLDDQSIKSLPSDLSSSNSNVLLREKITNKSQEKHQSESSDHKNEDTRDVALRIIILSINRYNDLGNLLKSLMALDSDGDRIDLHIFIDRLPNQNGTDERPDLGINSRVLDVSLSYQSKWPFGSAMIHKRPYHYGATKQFLYSWQDAVEGAEILDDNIKSKAIIFRDNCNASPYFWLWLKAAQTAYQNREDVAGYTLQALDNCMVMGLCASRTEYNTSAVILSPYIGPLAYSPSAKSWIRFVKSTQQSMSKMVQPQFANKHMSDYVVDLYSSTSTCSLSDCVWPMWHMMFVKNSVRKFRLTVYAQPPDGSALAIESKRLSRTKLSGVKMRQMQRPSPTLFDKKELLSLITQFSDEPTVTGWRGTPMKYMHPHEFAKMFADPTNPYKEVLEKYHNDRMKKDPTITKKQITFTFIDSALINALWDFYETCVIPFGVTNFVVIATDPVVYEMLQKKPLKGDEDEATKRRHNLEWPLVIKHEKADEFAISKDGMNYYDHMFHEKDRLKLFTMRHVLKLGFEVLVSDIDVKYFNNVWKDEYLSSIVDFGCQYDSIEVDGTINCNGGYFFARPTERSIKYIEEAIESQVDAQRALNVAELRETVRQALPTDKFLPGSAFFEKNRYMFWDQLPKDLSMYAMVHNNWIVGNNAKNYRFREMLWINDDSDEYFSSPIRKYLTYANPKETNTLDEESAALRTAFTIAKITNRTLVMPRFHCHKCLVLGPRNSTSLCSGGAGGRFYDQCNLIANWQVEALVSSFGIDSFRESSFFNHHFVPKDVKEEVGLDTSSASAKASPIFAIESQRRKKVPIKPGSIVLKPKSKGTVTEKDILEWFVYDKKRNDLKVLRFDTLFGIFSPNFTNIIDSSWFGKLDKGVLKCTYRQYVHVKYCPFPIPFV